MASDINIEMQCFSCRIPTHWEQDMGLGVSSFLIECPMSMGQAHSLSMSNQTTVGVVCFRHETLGDVNNGFQVANRGQFTAYLIRFMGLLSRNAPKYALALSAWNSVTWLARCLSSSIKQHTMTKTVQHVNTITLSDWLMTSQSWAQSVAIHTDKSYWNRDLSGPLSLIGYSKFVPNARNIFWIASQTGRCGGYMRASYL